MRIFEHIPTSEMILVEGGSFMMGEKKDHQVTVPGFWIGKYPVTQALWKEVMKGENPSYFRGDERPVETVSWNKIKGSFLPELIRLTGKAYRLPSEAEWEYAARGGIWKEDFEYSGSTIINEVGWFNDNSHSETKPVGLKAPNKLGIYDMTGNVGEWCEDFWIGDYKVIPKDGSAFIEKNKESSYHSMRGMLGIQDRSRITFRYFQESGRRFIGSLDGFRLVLSLH